MTASRNHRKARPTTRRHKPKSNSVCVIYTDTTGDIDDFTLTGKAAAEFWTGALALADKIDPQGKSEGDTPALVVPVQVQDLLPVAVIDMAEGWGGDKPPTIVARFATVQDAEVFMDRYLNGSDVLGGRFAIDDLSNPTSGDDSSHHGSAVEL